MDKEDLMKEIESEVVKVVKEMQTRNEIKETTADNIIHKTKEHRLASMNLSYLKGTKDFLIWIEKLKSQYREFPPMFSFITMDFVSMCPFMPDNLVLP